MTTGASTNAGGNVPKCGTPGTPPCPPPDTFFETRTLVIDQLAGAGASRKRRCAITAQVDTYLQTALRGAFALIRGSEAVPAEIRSGAASSRASGASLLRLPKRDAARLVKRRRARSHKPRGR